MKSTSLRLLSAAALLMAASGVASASVMGYGNFAFAPISGFVTYAGVTLPTATSITFSGDAITGVPATYLGNTNIFLGESGTDLTINTGETNTLQLFTADTGPYADFMSWMYGGHTYSFDTSTLLVSSSGVGELTLSFSGTFEDSLNTYTNGPALVILSLNDAGGGEATYSATFATPPPNVPEPATLAMFGSALIGLGLVGRKRWARR